MTVRLPKRARDAHPTPVQLTEAETRFAEFLVELALDQWEREQAANETPEENRESA